MILSTWLPVLTSCQTSRSSASRPSHAERFGFINYRYRSPNVSGACSAWRPQRVKRGAERRTEAAPAVLRSSPCLIAPEFDNRREAAAPPGASEARESDMQTATDRRIRISLVLSAVIGILGLFVPAFHRGA